jgi:hypothetical protein
MENWQQFIVLVYALLNLGIFLKGYYECKFRKNAYGLTPYLNFLGVFVWGDAVVFCLFWIAASLITYLLKDWYLFLLIVSVFWVVRSLGETIYWFNEQFSTTNRNPPEKLLFHNIFHNDSVWFVYQIIWQCVTVISVVFTIYFSKLWLISRLL